MKTSPDSDGSGEKGLYRVQFYMRAFLFMLGGSSTMLSCDELSASLVFSHRIMLMLLR